MNIRDLKYLIAIADHQHFGKAAEASFISQPALSMQIKKLENHLGVQLIERTNKSVALTDVGKLMTEHARDILDRIQTMNEAVKQKNDPFSGEFHLGIFPTLAPYLLPHIIPGLSKTFPNLKIYLIEEKTNHLIEKLNQGKLDSAFLSLPVIDENFIALPLFEEEFLLAVPPNHSFAKRKNIRMTDLTNKKLLLLEDGHCLRDTALEICYQAKATEIKEFRATSLETLRHMVIAKAGITLIPKLAYKSNDDICYLPFSSPKPIRTIGMVWRPSTPKKILLKTIVQQVRKLMLKQKIVKVIHTPIVCHKSHQYK